MSQIKTPAGYSRTQIALHGGIAALIIAQFVLHDPIVDAWKARTEGLEPAFSPLVATHVFGGITILALVCWRLFIRNRRVVPAVGFADRFDAAQDTFAIVTDTWYEQ